MSPGRPAGTTISRIICPSLRPRACPADISSPFTGLKRRAAASVNSPNNAPRAAAAPVGQTECPRRQRIRYADEDSPCTRRQQSPTGATPAAVRRRKHRRVVQVQVRPADDDRDEACDRASHVGQQLQDDAPRVGLTCPAWTEHCHRLACRRLHRRATLPARRSSSISSSTSRTRACRLRAAAARNIRTCWRHLLPASCCSAERLRLG